MRLLAPRRGLAAAAASWPLAGASSANRLAKASEPSPMPRALRATGGESISGEGRLG